MFKEMNIVGVCFWITTRCNLRCNICYSNLNSIEDNTLDGYLAIISKLSNLGFKKIAFSGGEPLLVKQIITILEYAKQLELKIALTTNANLIDTILLSKLNCIIDEISVPIDGLTDNTSNLHRTSVHDNKKAKHIIQISSQYNFKLDASTVLTNKNIHESLNILDFLEKNNIYKWKVFQYSELNKPKNMFIDFNISEDEFSECVSKIKHRIEIMSYKIQVDFRNNNGSSINSYVNIMPNGNILLSKDNSYINAGNILNFNNIDELNNNLLMNDFSFKDHLKRHFRDI